MIGKYGEIVGIKVGLNLENSNNDSFEYSVESNIERWRSIDGSYGYIINGNPVTVYSAPRPPPEPDKCEECGRTEPDLRLTKEADSFYSEEMEDEVWWDDEYHCADCREELGIEPIGG